jgi:hypothetical protein
MREVNEQTDQRLGRAATLLLLAALAVACSDGGADQIATDPESSASGGSPTTNGEPSGTGGHPSMGSGGASGGRTASGGSAQGGAQQGGANAGGNAGGSAGPPSYAPGGPGCGLDHAAFCDTFDAPSRPGSRAGELDPSKWSAARMCDIGGPTADDRAVAIHSAKLPKCRGDLPTQVVPDQDALICDPSDTVQGNHLMVVVAAQNYGQNSYRIRQPFDFADRTGTVVFDAEGANVGLLGWVSVEITEDPTPAPSFTLQQNLENGAVPRNGLEIQLGLNCSGACVGIMDMLEYDDFAQTVVYDGAQRNLSVPASTGKLNHFQVKLSTKHVDVYATPASSDGKTFAAPVLIGSADLKLGFSRGYVHMTTHNHATMKYSNDTVDAWVARWDNVGFDGPAMVGAYREYSIPDSLSKTSSGMINVAYRLTDASKGPAQVLTFDKVDLTNVTGARLALENWSYHAAGSPAPTTYALNYRLNGHGWHARPLTAGELQMMTTLPNAGTRSVMVDVDVAELVSGKNTLELTTTNAAPEAVPVALNIDLVLKTN